MGGRIRSFVVAVTTTGGAGVATGSGVTTESVEGFLLDISLDYHASAPATTDVVVTQSGIPTALLTVANNATDGRYAVRDGAATVAAGAAITNSFVPIPINGLITVAVAECDALTAAVTATIRVHTL